MIDIKNLTKSYSHGDVVTHVLRDISFSVDAGSWVAIMGKSGAGKSTLLYQVSLLDEPTSGDILIDTIPTRTLTDNEKTDFRLHNMGYVFQDYALVKELSALENVMVPLLMKNMSKNEAQTRAQNSLCDVGLQDRMDHMPNQLSGGEQQRVSIARALAQDPKILFADEPTANLDSATSLSIINLFREIHKRGQTIVMVTHEPEYTEFCDRTIILEDGKIIRDTKK